MIHMLKNKYRHSILFAIIFTLFISIGGYCYFFYQKTTSGELTQITEKYQTDLNLAFMPLFQNFHDPSVFSEYSEQDYRVLIGLLDDIREKVLSLIVPSQYKELHLQAIVFLSEFESALLAKDTEKYSDILNEMSLLQDMISNIKD